MPVKKRTGLDAGLRSLMNVSPSIERDLIGLGIRSIRELASAEAPELFRRLELRCGRRVDPCVYDTFRAVIHEARTGEKTPWFAWPEDRKAARAHGRARAARHGTLTLAHSGSWSARREARD